MSPAGFEPTPGTLRQGNQRFRPLGHDGLTMIYGLMLQDSGIKINKIDYGYMYIWTDCQT